MGLQIVHSQWHCGWLALPVVVRGLAGVASRGGTAAAQPRRGATAISGFWAALFFIGLSGGGWSQTIGLRCILRLNRRVSLTIWGSFPNHGLGFGIDGCRLATKECFDFFK
jgi:hypothetical protein